MKCLLCEREALPELCRHHEAGLRAVEAGYEGWRRAYGALSWEGYLEMVVKNPETGAWASEAARLLLQRAKRGDSGPAGAGLKS